MKWIHCGGILDSVFLKIPGGTTVGLLLIIGPCPLGIQNSVLMNLVSSTCIHRFPKVFRYGSIMQLG